MSSVYNWQLGREMEYPYSAAFPKRQLAFVFNLNRCLGCQTCTMACKSTWTFAQGQENTWWNNVETKPYGGYPQHWDFRALESLEQANPGGQTWAGTAKDLIAPYGEYKGKTLFEAASISVSPEGGQRALGYLPHDAEYSGANRFEDSPAGAPPGRTGEFFNGAVLQSKPWFFYLPRICNHCTYPACLANCSRNAIYKRPEDGIVLIDQERCRGYRKCVEGCPYKKAFYRSSTRASEKCIGCFPRIEGLDPESGGSPMQTRCSAACIGQARLQGLVQLNPDGTWKEDRYHPLYYLVQVAKVALPLYPQFGTAPNGYYLPPRWAPRPFLNQMFGPGVDQAVERCSAADRELLAVLQLFGKDSRLCFRYEIKPGPKAYETQVEGRTLEVFNDTVIGYGQDGTELIRTTVEEPIHLRPVQHPNTI